MRRFVFTPTACAGIFRSRRWVAVALCLVVLGTAALAADAVPVPKGYSDAMSWYQRAAEAGNPRAQYYLGLIYWRGLHGPKDPKRAADWFEKAARQGHAAAQFSLGLAYQTGTGRAKDLAKAGEWYAPAARAGHIEAAYNLGVLYEGGEGVEKNAAQAAILFERAAKGGLARAQYNLGLLYSKGEGVPLDRVHAWRWLNMARQAGYDPATPALKSLERSMSKAERMKARSQRPKPNT
jgi:TPR repeat protein